MTRMRHTIQNLLAWQIASYASVQFNASEMIMPTIKKKKKNKLSPNAETFQ